MKKTENAIRKEFEFVATIRDGNIASKIFKEGFNLMDKVYLKNDKP